MSHPMSKASPALQAAQTSDAGRLRSPLRPAKIVATTTPIATGRRAGGPNATMVPAARPAAGQKAATPSGVVSKPKLNLLARKHAVATAAPRVTAAIQGAATPASSSEQSAACVRELSSIRCHPLARTAGRLVEHGLLTPRPERRTALGPANDLAWRWGL